MAEKETVREIINLTETAATVFTESAKTSERGIILRINRYIRLLELDQVGNIKPTTTNFRIVRELRNDIEAIVLNKQYLERLGRYLRTFSEVKGVTDGFFGDVSTEFIATKPLFEEILDFSVESTRKSLTTSGINQFVIDPIMDIINKSISSGAALADMEEDLRTVILGDEKRLGTLERYTSQITRDALNQYSANYNEAITKDLGMEWYFYSGGIIDDTRDYCKKRNGKYFHKKEVEDVPADWAGRIPGTNSSTIFIYRGGYNCRHLYLSVMVEAVPRSVVRRNISNGNYKP